jgi:hypothetical protein
MDAVLVGVLHQKFILVKVMHQKPFSIRSKLGLCILPFLQGLDDSSDRSARMHFLNDSIGF